MKISEIVKVNLTSESVDSPISTNLNLTAGVVVITDGAGTTDLKWLTAAEVIAGVAFTNKAAFERLVATYSNNGGVNLVVKRIFSGDLSESSNAAEVIAAINGSDVHTAVDIEVINIMLVDEESLITSSLEAIAQGVKNTTAPEEEKIIMVNLTTAAIPQTLGAIDNIFLNAYAVQADGSAVAQNNYEVALAAAYVSKINYENDVIKGFDYTSFQGYNSSLENLNIANSVPLAENNGGTYSNIITYLVGRYLAIGNVMTNGSNFLSRYFAIVMTQKITKALTTLVVNKLKFSNSTYASISNTLTILLDVFTNNGLLDTEYVVETDYSVTIDNVSYATIKAGDTFTEGYRVFTLPPSQADLAGKTYSGVYVYIAIGTQIVTINVNGLTLGGI